MPAATIPELEWRSLSGTFNLMQTPASFLKNTFWGNNDPQPTDKIDLHYVKGDRRMAPLVRQGSEAVVVSGTTAEYATIKPPNIRIKRPFTPSQLLFNRQPGTTIYPSGQSMQQAIRRHIARDLRYMEDMVTNREEWFCAMMLRGRIEYEDENTGEAWQITLPRPSEYDITLSVFWDAASDAKDIDIRGTAKTVKRQMNKDDGFVPTDCILGTEASDLFERAVVAQKIGDRDAPRRGTVDLTQQYNDQGVIYLGYVDGINYWEYSRELDGTPLIRPKYAEYLDRSARSRRVTYYGAIDDMDALEGRQWPYRRFSKSWVVKDPSARWALVASRPLPWTIVPTSQMSVKVVSG